MKPPLGLETTSKHAAAVPASVPLSRSSPARTASAVLIGRSVLIAEQLTLTGSLGAILAMAGLYVWLLASGQIRRGIWIVGVLLAPGAALAIPAFILLGLWNGLVSVYAGRESVTVVVLLLDALYMWQAPGYFGLYTTRGPREGPSARLRALLPLVARLSMDDRLYLTRRQLRSLRWMLSRDETEMLLPALHAVGSLCCVDALPEVRSLAHGERRWQVEDTVVHAAAVTLEALEHPQGTPAP